MKEDRLRNLGTILELVALPFLVIVAVLLNLPNKDLGTIGVLLIIGALLFLTGLWYLISLAKIKKRNKTANQEICVSGFDHMHACAMSLY